MDTQLRVTLPGPEGSADARRSLEVLNRFLTLLDRVEEATVRQQGTQRTTWGFTDLRLGSLVTTLAPNRLPEGATSALLGEVAARTVTGLSEAQDAEGLPGGWNLQAARAGVDMAQQLGLLHSDGIRVELLHDGVPTRQVTVTRRAAENLTVAVKTRRRSIGSVIGRLDTLSLHGRREAGLWHERTNERVTVTFADNQTDEVIAALGKRVEVAGHIIRDIEDRPVSIKLRSIDIMSGAPASDLVGLDPNLTGGMEPTLYLREIRGAS